MTTEPELPYFPLPLEHERPTRRWGAYCADAAFNVDGVNWGFRIYPRDHWQAKTYFTALPFLEQKPGGEKHRIFAVDGMGEDELVVRYSSILSLLSDIQNGSASEALQKVDFTDDLYRILNVVWDDGNRDSPVALGCSGKGHVIYGDNGEDFEVDSYQFEHEIDAREVLNLEESGLEFLIFDKINTTAARSQNVLRGLDRNSDGNSWLDDLDEQETKRLNKFESMLICALKLEDDIWSDQIILEEDGVSVTVNTDSQFESAACKIYFEADVVDARIEEDKISNRLSNLIEIGLDELALRGARSPEGASGVMPFCSIWFTMARTMKPTQHEKMEALLELKQLLLSGDISEQDAELLLADKLPKGWLSQQPKIK